MTFIQVLVSQVKYYESHRMVRPFQSSQNLVMMEKIEGRFKNRRPTFFFYEKTNYIIYKLQLT